jgi:hypothetical protein
MTKLTEHFERKAIKQKRGDTGPKQYRTALKWSPMGGRMVAGRGETQEAADEACLEKIRERFRGTFTPLWLSFRGETVLAWRDGSDWIYGHIREGLEPSSLVIGNWKSRDEAERDARLHLAMLTWDDQEETSEIITHPEDQGKFTSWARMQKAFMATYQRLLAVGWTKEEASHLLSGGSVPPERIQALGDPLPLLRQKEKMFLRDAVEARGETC